MWNVSVLHWIQAGCFCLFNTLKPVLYFYWVSHSVNSSSIRFIVVWSFWSLPCQSDFIIYFLTSVSLSLWRNIGRRLVIMQEKHFIVLFIWLFGDYSVLTPHEPVDFITAECGLSCGSFASNGCSLYWERIHGCHAISTACQEHVHT